MITLVLPTFSSKGAMAMYRAISILVTIACLFVCPPFAYSLDPAGYDPATTLRPYYTDAVNKWRITLNRKQGDTLRFIWGGELQREVANNNGALENQARKDIEALYGALGFKQSSLVLDEVLRFNQFDPTNESLIMTDSFDVVVKFRQVVRGVSAISQRGVSVTYLFDNSSAKGKFIALSSDGIPGADLIETTPRVDQEDAKNIAINHFQTLIGTQPSSVTPAIEPLIIAEGPIRGGRLKVVAKLAWAFNVKGTNSDGEETTYYMAVSAHDKREGVFASISGYVPSGGSAQSGGGTPVQIREKGYKGTVKAAIEPGLLPTGQSPNQLTEIPFTLMYLEPNPPVQGDHHYATFDSTFNLVAPDGDPPYSQPTYPVTFHFSDENLNNPFFTLNSTAEHTPIVTIDKSTSNDYQYIKSIVAGSTASSIVTLPFTDNSFTESQVRAHYTAGKALDWERKLNNLIFGETGNPCNDIYVNGLQDPFVSSLPHCIYRITMEVNTNAGPSGSPCNAYYQPSDDVDKTYIQLGKGRVNPYCANFAYGSLIWHEIGHQVSQYFGSYGGAPSFTESLADAFAMYMANDPIVGPNWAGDLTRIRSGLSTRRKCQPTTAQPGVPPIKEPQFCYDKQSGDYQSTSYSELHEDLHDEHNEGEIFGGVLWKIRDRALYHELINPAVDIDKVDLLFWKWLHVFNDTNTENILREHLLSVDSTLLGGALAQAIESGFDAHGFGVDQAVPETDVVKMEGPTHFGKLVLHIGDITGDGVGEVGILSEDVQLWVYSGTDLSQPLTVYSSLGSTLYGAGAGGDLTGDNVPDVVLGLGSARVLSGALLAINSPNPVYGSFTFGTALSQVNDVKVGDINGDGKAELLAGSFNASKAAVVSINSPSTYTVLWSKSGPTNSKFGISVSAIDDVTGDGLHDVIIGCSECKHPTTGEPTGRAFVYNGLTGAEHCVMNGHFISDKYGQSVANAGHIDGDNFGDFLVGAYWGGNGASTPGYPANGGYAQLFSGGQKVGESCKLLKEWVGESEADFLSLGLAGGEDIDGDGWDDFAISSYQYDVAGGTDQGLVQIFSGVDYQSDSPAFYFDGGTISDKAALGYNLDIGDVNGDGKADIVSSAHIFFYSDKGAFAIIYGFGSSPHPYEVSRKNYLQDGDDPGEVTSLKPPGVAMWAESSTQPFQGSNVTFAISGERDFWAAASGSIWRWADDGTPSKVMDLNLDMDGRGAFLYTIPGGAIGQTYKLCWHKEPAAPSTPKGCNSSYVTFKVQ